MCRLLGAFEAFINLSASEPRPARVGYLVAPPDLARILTGMQEPIISCVNTLAQMAALAAVTGPQDVVREVRDSYRARRDELLGVLDRGGLPSSRPSGAFYVWTDVSEAGVLSMEFARSLIEREHVAVAPGSAFGERGEGYVRLSVASSREDLLEGTSRLIRSVRLLGEVRGANTEAHRRACRGTQRDKVDRGR
jgi:aspartate aminotransferase